MKLFKKKLKPLYENLSTLPVYNFHQIRKTGDLSYLYAKGGRLDKQDFKRCYDKWLELDAEFIDRFALNEEFINKLLIEKTILLLKLELTISENSILKNRILAEEKKLEDLVGGEQNSDIDIDKMISNVEKFMGFQIDIYKTSTAKVYSYINQMQEIARNNAE